MAPKGVTLITERDQSEKLSKDAQWPMQQRKIVFRPEKSKGWIQKHGTQRGYFGDKQGSVWAVQ